MPWRICALVHVADTAAPRGHHASASHTDSSRLCCRAASPGMHPHWTPQWPCTSLAAGGLWGHHTTAKQHTACCVFQAARQVARQKEDTGKKLINPTRQFVAKTLQALLTVPQKRRHNVCTLALIRCDHTQLVGHDAALQEACEQLLNIGRLSAVQVAGACKCAQNRTQ